MMDELNIKAILKAGESQTVEFKTSFGRETIESLDALSVEKIEKFIAQVNECGRFSLDQSPLLALEKIKYVVNGRPNWAAMLLFAEEPVRHHIHIGRFKTPSMIIDDRQQIGRLLAGAAIALEHFDRRPVHDVGLVQVPRVRRLEGAPLLRRLLMLWPYFAQVAVQRCIARAAVFTQATVID